MWHAMVSQFLTKVISSIVLAWRFVDRKTWMQYASWIPQGIPRHLHLFVEGKNFAALIQKSSLIWVVNIVSYQSLRFLRGKKTKGSLCLPLCRTAMRRAEANLRAEGETDVEGGYSEDAGMEPPAHVNTFDYIKQAIQLTLSRCVLPL